jgi:eukaryotic-like serine/threonine-protein kinase
MSEPSPIALLPPPKPRGMDARRVADSSAQLPEDPRVTQALEEYLASLEAGRLPDRQQLLARFPDVADRLDDYLDGLDFLHRTVARMNPGSCSSSSRFKTEPLTGPIPSLEDYKILREIGRGGMGIVYEAVQRSLNRRVALKVLSLGATLDPRHLQRFKNESQAAAHLQHPNIVPVFAVGCEQGVHYYAMRFIEGKTLSELIEEGRPETPDKTFFRQAAWIGVQAAEALEYAHQMGVIHRDVKPANLLLDKQGGVWIADFGLARWSSDHALTTTGDMLGTLRYMSPEQATARRGLVDHRTDVYSLGATLYELLTSEPACPGGDHHEMLQQILHEDPVPPRRLCRNIPKDLETILLKALGKQVEERYATAQELADDLRRFLDERPIVARRPALWERANKWARRHRSLVVSAAVVLVLSVVALMASTILIGREQAKTRRAYELEAEARQTEGEARTRAEQNFQQARQLLDDIAEIMADESDALNVRRKLLQAALSYYKDFLAQHNDNQLTREELMRGYTRIATLLEATCRGKEAQVVLQQFALKFGDGQAVFHVVSGNSKLRLLRLASVQEDLKLSPQQVSSLVELESRRNQRRRGQGPKDGEAVEKEAMELLNPEQAERLDQLLVQQAGLGAFEDPPVIAALELTADQRQDIAAFQRAAEEPQEEAGKGENRDGKSAYLECILRQLTVGQRARWQKLVGEPFKGVFPPADLVLTLGTVMIEVAPAGTPPEPKQGLILRPTPDKDAP